MSGIVRIFKSSKALAALIGIVALVLVRVFNLEAGVAGDLSTSIVTLVAIYIGATAAEDFATKIGKKGDDKCDKPSA